MIDERVVWSSETESFTEGPIELLKGPLPNLYSFRQDQYDWFVAIDITQEQLVSLANKIKELFPDGD